MKNKNVKGIVWGLTIAGLGVGVYFLIKKLLERSGEQRPQDSTGGDEFNSSPTPVSQATEPQANEHTWLERGSKGVEVEKVQLIFNDIRYKAKKLLKNATAQLTSGAMSQSVFNRLKQLSEIPYLKQNGEFNDQTKAVCQIVMGSHGTSLNKARCKRRDFYLKYTKENPYKGWNLKC